MAYKQKGCTPITAKIQKTTKGGMTNPLLKAIGVPMKENPSVAKQTKISNEMYNNRDMNIYGDLNKAEYDKEANRQISVRNKRFDNAKKMSKANSGGVSTSTDYTNGSTCSREDDACNVKGQSIRKRDIGYDVPKTKMRSKSKNKPVTSLKSEGVKSSKPKIEKTAEIKTAPKTKKEVRFENRTNRKTARKENRANRKATREENKANRKAARNASPAKQTMQQQNRKEKREANRKARRVAPKKGNAKMAKKAKVYGK